MPVRRLYRIALTFLLVLLSVTAVPGPAQASPAPAHAETPRTTSELVLACALKSNGSIRMVSAPAQCRRNERLVRFSPGPVLLCVQPSGSPRVVDSFRYCRRFESRVTLPPTSGVEYFCAQYGNGELRRVTDPARCRRAEKPVKVTPDDAAPTLVSSLPADAASRVGTGQTVSLTFSEPVSAAAGAVTLRCGAPATPVTGTVGGSGTSVLTFTPSAALPVDSPCTVTITAALVTDTDTVDPPDALASDRTVSFTTDAAPTLTSSSPADAATDVPVGSPITLTFSEPVDVTPAAFALTCGTSATPLPYALSGSGTATITLDPDADLPPTASCRLAVTAAHVRDTDTGDPPDTLASDTSITFTTRDAAPTLTATTPLDGATGIGLGASVTLTFSEPVNAQPDAVGLTCAATPVPGTLTGSGTDTLTFTPTAALTPATPCTVTVTAARITDTDTVDPPDALASDTSFSFTTDAAPTLTSSSPADAATDVTVGSPITLTFSEPVDVTPAAFALTCGTSATPLPYALSGSGTATITLDPDADLPPTASCRLAVTAAHVSDTDTGDPPDTLASDTSITFTTRDAAPTLTATTPLDGATGIGLGTGVTLTFSEPVNAQPDAVGLTCAATRVPGTLTGSGTSVLTFTPTAALTPATPCTVTITAARITDTDTVDPPDALASDTSFSFTTLANQPPTDIALSGAVVAENAASGTAVGTLSTTDADAGDTFTYTLVSGTGDSGNALFAITGTTLTTAVVLDFETTPTASVRVRSTDSAGGWTEKAFTVTVTDVNERPTDLTLTNASVAENLPAGTAVGTLAAVDPDAGQTHAFAVVATGCTSTYPDGAAFTTDGATLKTAITLDFEAKSSYQVCVRATDNGTPPLSGDRLFTITVTDVPEPNRPPVAAPDAYGGVIGNTLAAAGTTPTGPFVALTGPLLGANDTDPDGDTLSIVAGTVATTGGGSATLNGNGSFTYLPPLGARNTTDTFSYTVTDGAATAVGTVTMTIVDARVWYVDNAAPSAGADGRSTSPLTALAPLNGAGGAGDPDAAGDSIFVRTGVGTYAGGLRLEASQRLLGSPAGLTVASRTLVAPGGTAPTITNAAGDGLTLAEGVSVQGLTIAGATGDGLHSSGVGAASVGTTSPVSITGSGGDGVDLDGGTGSLAVAASISGSAGRSVSVANRTGGTVTFSGAIAGPGVVLSSNTGATVAFTGNLTLSAGAASAFSATGGGTVTATGTASTLTSTTGTTLVVDGTTIGAAGLRFSRVSANGAQHGVRLANTGSAGGLTVTGGGSTTRGGDASGGTIQNTTGPGVSLTNTANVSLTNLTVSSTPNAPGISGSGVTGFSFTAGTVSQNGLASRTARDSGIAFDDPAVATNVSGAVTVSNSVLTNAYRHGIGIRNTAGTITSLTLSNNQITSSTDVALTDGSGIEVDLGGTASTVANLSGGAVNDNTIRNFPDGGGIRLLGGNMTAPGSPAATFGTSGSPVQVNRNSIQGAGTTTGTRMNLNCIRVQMAGAGTGFVDLNANGTVAVPLANVAGNCLSVDAQGLFDLTSSITKNEVSGAGELSGASGISGGADALPAWGAGYQAVFRATVTNNTITGTGASGIYLLANSASTLRAAIENNSVTAPVGGGGAYGIRVMAGTGSSATNTTVCARIAGNTTAGGLNSGTGNTAPGIGLRKQGTVATTNTFGIVGLTPSPATQAQTVTYVSGQNPASAPGTSGAVEIVSGDNFTSCTLP